MLTYKGVASEGKVRVLGVSRTLLPSSEVETLSINGKAGAYFIRKKHGVRLITVDMAIVGESEDDLMDRVEDVADWLDAEKPEALIFNDEPEKKYFAIAQGDIDIDEQLKYGFFTIEFLCPDPYSVGNEKTETLSAGTKTVSYNGTAPVYPTATVSFSSAQPSFTISNGKEKVSVTFAFGTATTLVIDFNKDKITVNGTLNQQILTLDSDYFPLKKGTNTLTISAGATVVLKYNERFK